MRADDTAKFAELIVPMAQLDWAAGIAEDDRFQPFDMWPSMVEPYDFEAEDDDIDNQERAMGSFGAQTLFAIASMCAYVYELWRRELADADVRADGWWELPFPPARVWRHFLPKETLAFASPEWLARFLQCFVDIRFRIFDGSYKGALCFGEGVALMAVIDTVLKYIDGDGPPWVHSELPEIDVEALVGLLLLVRETHLVDGGDSLMASIPGANGLPDDGSWLNPTLWFVPYPLDIALDADGAPLLKSWVPPMADGGHWLPDGSSCESTSCCVAVGMPILRAVETNRFAQLVTPLSVTDQAVGIAVDDRSQPFDMWRSVVEPFTYAEVTVDDYDDIDLDSPLGAFGAQTMFAIATACASLHTVWRYELEWARVNQDGSWTVPSPGLWENNLPEVVHPFMAPVWMARFLRCFADLRLRIFDGSYVGPECVGEELALHMAIETARRAAKTSPWSHFYLPAIAADVLVGFLNDALYSHFDLPAIDADVLMLFDMPELIGVPGAETILHPNNWFTPLYAEVTPSPGRVSSEGAVM